jgi:hypothetical protein
MKKKLLNGKKIIWRREREGITSFNDGIKHVNPQPMSWKGRKVTR